MDEKLTKEECERLKEMFGTIAASEVLTKYDAVMLIDVLLEACNREKAAVVEAIMEERMRLQ